VTSTGSRLHGTRVRQRQTVQALVHQQWVIRCRNESQCKRAEPASSAHISGTLIEKSEKTK